MNARRPERDASEVATWDASKEGLSAEARYVRYVTVGRRWLVAVSHRGHLYLLDPSGPTLKHHYELGGQAQLGLALSPDESRLAVAVENRVKVVSIPDGAILADLPGHVQQILGLAFSPDGGWLASCSEDGTARLWKRTADGYQPVISLSAPHQPVLYQVAFNHDGTQLLVRGWDQRAVCVWHLDRLRLSLEARGLGW